MSKGKRSNKHNFGNMIAGVCRVLDGLIMIITLGRCGGGFQVSFNTYRRNTGFLLDSKNKKK